MFETPPEAKIGILVKFEISFNCLKFGPFNVPSLLISVQIRCEKFIPDILNNINSTMSIDNPIALFLLFISAVPIASFAEEIMFRGYLQQILEKEWKNITKAVLISSLFFAIVHLIPFWLIQIYLLGMIMGYLSWRTNSIYPSMVLHAVNNTMAFLSANWKSFFEGWYVMNGHVSPLGMIVFLNQK